jgi:predicted NBD/HSP70 family sugar kinase
VLVAAGHPDGSIEDVLAAAAAGDRQARAGLRRVGHWLGVGIANLVNVFNPEVVVFGGLLRQLLPATEDLVRAELATALAAPREQVRLALPQLGGDATLLGAAESAFAPLLDDPLGVLARCSDSAPRRTRA